MPWRMKDWKLGIGLGLALLTGAEGAGRQGGVPPAGLLDDVRSIVEEAEDPGLARLAPRFRVQDMYGETVDLDRYRGRIVVMTFLTPAARNEALGWLKNSQVDYLGDPDVAFINVLFPGPTNLFSSRRNRLRKIRTEIEEAYQNFYEALGPADRERLRTTEIRWIMDWRKDLIRRYDVSGDRVHLFFIDDRGDIREVIRRRTPETVRVLPRTIERLRSELARGSGPTPERPGW